MRRPPLAQGRAAGEQENGNQNGRHGVLSEQAGLMPFCGSIPYAIAYQAEEFH
jgi:hypothetical protein